MRETKAELRAHYKALRKALSDAEKEQLDQQLKEQFFRHIPLDAVSTLHLYAPIHRFREVDTLLIAQEVRKSFPEIKLVISRTIWQKRLMEHVYFSEDVKLEPNAQGIPEPVGGELCPSQKIDAVIVPLLTFDEEGHRLGYGGGFYDRFLAECTPHALRIGLSYFPPLDFEIPEVHEYDIRLTHCLTPEHAYTFD